MELSLAKKDPKEMILLKQNDRKAYVIMEYYGHYEDAYQKVYGVTLDKVKAEILKAESIESHKKKTESELPDMGKIWRIGRNFFKKNWKSSIIMKMLYLLLDGVLMIVQWKSFT